MRSLGWRPDPQDARDEQYGVWLKDLDKAEMVDTRLTNLMGPVLDQGSLGSCVAQAISKGIYSSHRRHGIESPDHLSRLAAWYLGRAMLGKASYNTGCHIRDVFKALNRLGFCPESLWPYDDNTGPGARFREKPSVECFRQSFDQRSSGVKPVGYRRLLDVGSDRADCVIRMLDHRLPVIFGTDVSESFAKGKLPFTPIKPPVGKTIAGGHAMVIAGYDTAGPDGLFFHVLNSWGTGWGDGGWCRFDPEYISWPVTRDLWVVDVAPQFGLV